MGKPHACSPWRGEQAFGKEGKTRQLAEALFITLPRKLTAVYTGRVLWARVVFVVPVESAKWPGPHTPGIHTPQHTPLLWTYTGLKKKDS